MPICGAEEESCTIVSDEGRIGTPDVVFSNSRTITEYDPPSAGILGSADFRISAISLEGELAAWTYGEELCPNGDTNKEGKENMQSTVRMIRAERLTDLLPPLL